MKRIDAYIPTIKRNQVMDAMIEAKIEGVTVVESKGKGVRSRPMIRGARGTSASKSEYNVIDYITTVVDDSKVKNVVDMIMNAAYTGNKGDGKIFVYSVDESYDISSKKKD